MNRNKDSLKITIPKSISLIAITLFLERFCYYGIRTSLVMYMLWEMDFSESHSIVWCHTFVIIYNLSNGLEAFLQYCVSSFGVTWIGIICEVAGFGYLLFPHVVSDEEDNNKKILGSFVLKSHFIGLFAIFIGAGLARPALMNLSVEHLKTENKSRLLDWQNISGVVAGLVVTILAPIWRDEKIPYKDEWIHVISIVFMVLISIAALCHIIGSFNFYEASKKQELDSTDVKNSLKHFRKIFCRAHTDVPNTFILWFFIPLVVIWSLLEQNFTYFVLQALKSDRDLFGLCKIQPVHVMALHATFLLLFIPFNKYVFDRCLEATIFEKPLKKVIIGCFFAIGAFICAFYYEQELNRAIVVPKGNDGHFRIYNAMKCDYLVQIESQQYFLLKHMEMYVDTRYKLDKETKNLSYTIKLEKNENEGSEGHEAMCPSKSGEIELKKGKAMGYLIAYVNENETGLVCYEDDPERSKDLRPKIRILGDTIVEKSVSIVNERGEYVRNTTSWDIDAFRIAPGNILVTVENVLETLSAVEVKEGAVYVFMIIETDDKHDFQLTVVTPAPSLEIWKIIPQFLLLAFAKSIIAGNYQAWLFQKTPIQLGPLVAPFYFLTIISGDLLIIILEQIKFVHDEWHFGMFAIIMLVDICLLTILMMAFLKEDSSRTVLDSTRVVVL